MVDIQAEILRYAKIIRHHTLGIDENSYTIMKIWIMRRQITSEQMDEILTHMESQVNLINAVIKKLRILNGGIRGGD